MKKYILSIAAIVIVFAAVGIVRAGTADLTGWSQNLGPWSSTIGWVNFNSSDANTGTNGVGNSSVAYKVSISTTTGMFTGSAWSPNIGWIKFNAGYPTGAGNGTVQSSAQVDMNTGAVTGWARACSGTVNKDCSSADRTDGLDGWIALSGDATNGGSYGVTLSTTTGAFGGYAWGSTNVGWLSFAGVICPDCVNGGSTATTPGSLGGTCSITSATSYPVGTVVTPTLALNITGGSGAPYTYSPQTFTLVSGSNLVVITVIDNNGQNATQFSCGTITGTGSSSGPTTPPIGNASLKLLIGSPSAAFKSNDFNDATGFKGLVLRKGETFKLQWNILGSAFDTCTLTSSVVPIGDWVTSNGTALSSVSGSVSTGYISPIISSNREVGKYQFTKTCSIGGDPSTASSSIVNLNIISSSETEI